MAGTREDVTTAQRRVVVDFPTQRDIGVRRPTPMRPHDEASTGTLDGDLELVGAHLAAAGFDHIVVVRHTRPDEVVQVVRVVVPGLEGTRLRNASLGERALRRTALPRPE
jgi:ribosomal protein S12 methylthiotransferase accessory factor YcaO